MSKLGIELAQGNMPMFMTPDEVTEHFGLGDSVSSVPGTPVGTSKPEEQKKNEEDTLAYKLHDAAHSQSHDGVTPLYDSIKREGVKRPLDVRAYGSRPELMDGHHRLAVSRHLNPKQFLPMEYN